MRFSLALFFLVFSPCLSQPLTVGVRGGGRLTSDDQDYGHPESRRYLIGPMLQVRLPLHFAFEADALYSRSGRSDYIPLIGNESIVRTRANSWEFPLLAVYRLPLRHVQPYLAAGIDPRASHFRVDVTGYQMVSISGEAPYASASTSNVNDHAWLAAAGLQFHAGHLRFLPEARYLWWDYPRDYSAGFASYIPRPRNEIQILVGIGWGL